MPYVPSASLLQFFLLSEWPVGIADVCELCVCRFFCRFLSTHTMCSHRAGQQPCYLQKKLLPSSILCGKWMFYATSTRFFNASFWYSFGISRSSRLIHLCRDTGLSSRICCRGLMVVSCILCSFSDAFRSASVPLIVKITSSSLFVCLWFSLLRFFFAPTSVSVDEVVHIQSLMAAFAPLNQTFRAVSP